MARTGTCPYDNSTCTRLECRDACAHPRAGEKAPHRTREELIADINSQLTGPYSKEERATIEAMFVELRRKPMYYRVTWLQHHVSTHETLALAEEQALIIQQRGSQCTDIKVMGIYNIDSK